MKCVQMWLTRDDNRTMLISEKPFITVEQLREKAEEFMTYYKGVEWEELNLAVEGVDGRHIVEVEAGNRIDTLFLEEEGTVAHLVADYLGEDVIRVRTPIKKAGCRQYTVIGPHYTRVYEGFDAQRNGADYGLQIGDRPLVYTTADQLLKALSELWLYGKTEFGWETLGITIHNLDDTQL